MKGKSKMLFSGFDRLKSVTGGLKGLVSRTSSTRKTTWQFHNKGTFLQVISQLLQLVHHRERIYSLLLILGHPTRNSIVHLFPSLLMRGRGWWGVKCFRIRITWWIKVEERSCKNVKVVVSRVSSTIFYVVVLNVKISHIFYD